MSCSARWKSRIQLPLRILVLLIPALVSLPIWADYPEQPQFYVGVGVGSSTVEPDKAETGVKTTDDRDTGVKLTIGQELTDHLAVEAFALDLGDARLENGGAVGYRGFGAGVLLSAPSNSTLFSGYLKGGLAYQQVSASVPVEINTDIEAFAGVGLELQGQSGLSLRGEYEHYTTDTQLLSLSILKRFGGDAERPAVKQRAMESGKETAENPAPAAAPAVSPLRREEKLVHTETDSDNDGVNDNSDRCPGTPGGVVVDLNGCANFLGLVHGVHFASGSAELDVKARATLDKVARNMRNYKHRRFLIIGHADSRESYTAKRLSMTRAYRAARYLVSRGVPASVLRFGGRGDRDPLVSNRTEKGRAYNRRIEIRFANGVKMK
ncbi:MAG TPA: OmpA family protein [Gammaproteobacteria bacterium]|nr:OmpA family protein [Gammaproteobacteria bacterium]